MMTIQAVEISLTVRETGRAARFWSGLLGVPTPRPSSHRVELARDSVRLALQVGDEPAPRSSMGLTIHVDDLDASCARVLAHGGEIRGGPSPRDVGPCRLAWVADPDGNAFLLSERCAGCAEVCPAT